jgi:putative ABC transport system permease protein
MAHPISFFDLIWIFIPIIVVYFIYYRWNNDSKTLPYALSRMVLQLILLGYILTYIFTSKNFFLIIFVLTIMLIVAGVIALRPITNKNPKHYLISFTSIAVGGIITLAFVIVGVLHLELWYEPRFLIPLAGMIFANSMNSVSIAAERFEVEFNRENIYEKARNIAYKASLIKDINSLFAVGLVSIPGMMTGQILSGVEPIETVKYQIMVMCMIIASSGISTAIYLKWLEKSENI